MELNFCCEDNVNFGSKITLPPLSCMAVTLLWTFGFLKHDCDRGAGSAYYESVISTEIIGV
jgi:hypothetical protein